MSSGSLLSGRLPAALSNAVSDAIHAALESGMEIDEAACVVVSVASDYARLQYGNDYLGALANVVLHRASMPMPDIVEPGGADA